MITGIWIVAGGLLAATAVIALLAASRSGQRKASDGTAGSDGGYYTTPTSDFGSDSASDSGICDSGGADGGGSDGGGGGCD